MAQIDPSALTNDANCPACVDGSFNSACFDLRVTRCSATNRSSTPQAFSLFSFALRGMLGPGAAKENALRAERAAWIIENTVRWFFVASSRVVRGGDRGVLCVSMQDV